MTFDLGSPLAPKFWRNETGGQLHEAIGRYLEAPGRMTSKDIALVRAYICQWVNSPVWELNPLHYAESLTELADLRESARLLFTVADIHAWIDRALDAGIDPF
jgi:hypothetical protein